ncbi:MAG: hypothetical protein KatS3mg033_1281 [Thermonema sp.]|uniref:WG repeat-containing protein n=1 Tax=Thermonema sp. TaxID=2231181 RepID=UPI0021DDE2F9|nr:WG repeat-containing protein [Thermonema sp.]GIV39481.1 MAG: hypothetical protein KatS3mg033_1281 [Thermonema sp.]
MRPFVALLAFLCLCLFDGCRSQENDIHPPPPSLIPYRISQNWKVRWGYCTPSKQIAIKTGYETAEPFDSTLHWAKVKKNGLWGYIDRQGKEIIPIEFKAIWAFRNGIAPACNKQGKWGLIDSLGNEVLACRFERLSKPNEAQQATALYHGQWGIIHRNGTWLLPPAFEATALCGEGLLAAKKKGQWFFYDAQGRLLSEESYRRIGQCRDGRIAVANIVNGEYRYGFAGKHGHLVIPLQFKEVHDFSEQLAAAQDAATGKWGFVDTTGQWHIPPRYDQVRDFKQGRASVQSNGYWGIINTQGQAVVEFLYTILGNFSEGLAPVQYQGRWGYITSQGANAIAFFEAEQAGTFSQGLAAVKHKGKWGYINRKGEWQIPPQYEEAAPFRHGLAKVRFQGNEGYIDAAGRQYWK